MNFFEQEMRRFFEDCDFISDQKYTGRTMLGRLDDELLVKATLVSTHIADHYNAVRIKILNAERVQSVMSKYPEVKTIDEIYDFFKTVKSEDYFAV